MMMGMKDAADYLGISWETLRKWVAVEINIPCYRYPRPTSPPRFRKADLDRWIERHRVATHERLRSRKAAG